MTEQRKQEAEEAGKCYRDTPIFVAGYLAACEKLEKERDELLEKIESLQWKLAYCIESKQKLIEQFKTHNNE